MTDDQKRLVIITALAERVMEWEKIGDGLYWDGKKSRLLGYSPVALKRREMEAGDRPGDGFLFEPNISMEDAWSVVLKMRDKKHHVYLWESPGQALTPAAEFRVKVDECAAGKSKMYQGSGATMPVAICVAALLSINFQIPDEWNLQVCGKSL